MTATPPHAKNQLCLFKTAVAIVLDGSRTVIANLLFDEGSQPSFITQGLAICLTLKPN